jgi:Icc-related predicted phosphoesterase
MRSIWLKSALRDRAGGDWSAIIPSFGSPQALHLRLSEPVQSIRRLEREAGRNVEVMWLLGRLAPDHKTIADFRKDNGLALRRRALSNSAAR